MSIADLARDCKARAEKGGKYKKNQPIFNVLALNIG
jgi:hypothetical protein